MWCILLLKSFSITYTYAHVHNHKHCANPHNLPKRLHKINRGLDMKRLLLPCVTNNIVRDIRKLQTVSKELGISRICPNTTMKGNYPLMIRSSCPWYLETDRNVNRYPVDIVYANTRCKHGCIGSNGHMTCERIQLPVKVLKRVGCKHGVNQYKEEKMLLPVAYTCAKPRERENSWNVDTSSIEIQHFI